MELNWNYTAQEAMVFMMPARKPNMKTDSSEIPVSVSPNTHLTYSANYSSESHEPNVTNESYLNETDLGMFDRNEALLKVEIAVLATIMHLAIFGNSIVLFVLRMRRQKLTRMQWFIAHLAIADLFVAIFHILPQLVWDITVQFYGNDFLCRAVTYFQVVAMYASSYVLVMAAVDRYLSICHPLTSQTLSPKRVHLMIALAWLISLIFSLPQIFIFGLKNGGENSYQCYGEFAPGWGVPAYVTWIFASDYALPFMILAFCYGKICHVVWSSVGSKESTVYVSVRSTNLEPSNKASTARVRCLCIPHDRSPSVQSRDRHDSTPVVITSSACHIPRGHQRGVSRSKMKTVKLTLAVVLCYLFCWAPYFVVQMWTAFREDDSVLLEEPVVVILMLLASLNSCTNPWIYLVFSGRSCPHGNTRRRTSRSWVPSTHVTSAGDSSDSKGRASLIDLSHVRLHARQNSPKFIARKGRGFSKC